MLVKRLSFSIAYAIEEFAERHIISAYLKQQKHMRENNE
jgi:hypothetical protein